MIILAIDPGNKCGFYYLNTETNEEHMFIKHLGSTHKSKITKLDDLLYKLKPDIIYMEEPTSFGGLGFGQTIISVKSQMTFLIIIKYYCIKNNVEFKSVHQAKLFNWVKKSGIARTKSESNSADDEDAYLVYRYFTEGGDEQYGYDEI